LRVGVVHLVVLACLLRATSKKVIKKLLFKKKKVHPRENAGYAYEFAQPWKKILRCP